MNPITVLLIGNAGGSSGGGGGGGGGAGVDIFNTSATGLGVASATATYKLAASGTGSSTGQPDWDWLLSGLNSDYQVYASVTSGSTPSGSLNSWISLNTDRLWTVSASGSGSTNCTLDIQIRRAVDSVVIDTATVTMKATVAGGTS